jgi:DNA-binding beta-propeller fold protein YncE
VVLDRATLAVIRTFTGGSPRRIAFNRAGTTAVIANEAGYVTFIK